jgi:hypothetical protein
MRRLIGFVLVLVVGVVVAGCGGDARHMGTPARSQASAKKAPMKSEEARQPAQREAAAGGERAPEAPAAKQAEKPLPRKVIYTGDISLIVDNFDTAEEALLAFVKEYDGYVARSDIQGEPNRPRQGSWTIRIPSAKGEDFLKAVGRLGELRRSNLDSKDITDQYYDLQAAMTNLEVEEKAIRKLYDEKIAGSDLAKLLEVRRELARVRGEINTMKGQLQRWDKEVAFTTFTVSIFDRRGYVPPVSPAFTSTIGRTFSESIDVMIAMGKGIVLIVVALAPWLVLFALVGLPVFLIVRQATHKSPPPPVPTAELAAPPPASGITP